MSRVEWKIVRDMEYTEKSWKLSTKQKTQKNVENSIFRIFKSKIIMKNLRLVKLLWKFNKNFTLSVNMAYPADFCTFRYCIP